LSRSASDWAGTSSGLAKVNTPIAAAKQKEQEKLTVWITFICFSPSRRYYLAICLPNRIALSLRAPAGCQRAGIDIYTRSAVTSLRMHDPIGIIFVALASAACTPLRKMSIPLLSRADLRSQLKPILEHTGNTGVLKRLEFF
jgi:hypothetical protein